MFQYVENNVENGQVNRRVRPGIGRSGPISGLGTGRTAPIYKRGFILVGVPTVKVSYPHGEADQAPQNGKNLFFGFSSGTMNSCNRPAGHTNRPPTIEYEATVALTRAATKADFLKLLCPTT